MAQNPPQAQNFVLFDTTPINAPVDNDLASDTFILTPNGGSTFNASTSTCTLPVGAHYWIAVTGDTDANGGIFTTDAGNLSGAFESEATPPWSGHQGRIFSASTPSTEGNWIDDTVTPKVTNFYAVGLIPEPKDYALIFGLLGLIGVGITRRLRG